MKYAISQQEQDHLFQKISQWMACHPPLIQSNSAELSNTPFQTNYPLRDLIYQGNSRLGFWYQHLCHQHFLSHPNYQVLAEEVQLNHEGKTIGAIDFILQNTRNQQVEHWEVAVKFYMLFDGLWYGPNSRDRLDLKLAHMLDHQLSMSQHPAFKALYPELDQIQPKLLMQGRLYINPFRDEKIPTHCLDHPIETSQVNGYWCFWDEWQQIAEPLYVLKKGQWLTGKESNSELLTTEQEHFVHCQTESGEFWFILPRTWPSKNKIFK
ncbi:MAG: DUF1853 family protein [Vibrio sp.]